MTTHTDTLANYGYTMTSTGEIVHPNGKASGVILKSKGARLQARMDTGGLLWSGSPDSVGNFLEGFWFAEKVTR